jgi:L-malate glycosyltransferase
MRSRIYIVTNSYPTKHNPIRGVFVKRMVDNLSSSCDKVIIHNNYGEFKLLGYLIFYIKTLWALFRNDGYFYVHQVTHSGILFKFFPKARVIFNFHGYDLLPPNLAGKLMLYSLQSRIRSAQGIVAPSKFFRDLIVRDLFVSKENVFISPSGGIEKHQTPQIPRRFKLGMISRFEDAKGWEDFFRLVNEFDRLYPGLAYYAGGYGNTDFINNFLDSAPNVTSDTELYHSDVIERMMQIEYFVFPSKHRESLGLVAVEAVSLGCKLITSNLGALPEVVYSIGGVSTSFENIESVLKYVDNDDIIWFKDGISNYDAESVGSELSGYVNSIFSQ